MNQLNLILAFTIVTLAGCTPGVSEVDSVKASVKGSMKDPESAKFGKVTIVGKYACSTVNGKNSYGGYTGDQIAYSLKDDSRWITFEINKKVSHDDCVKVMTEQNAKEPR